MAIKELFDRAYGEASQHIESEQHVTVRASMRGARSPRLKPDNVTNPCAGFISVGHQTAFLNVRAF
jgi:hypothetical protein